MTAFGVRLPVLALGLLATACSDDTTTSPGTTKTAETTTSSSPWFQDVATESGIDFT